MRANFSNSTPSVFRMVWSCRAWIFLLLLPVVTAVALLVLDAGMGLYQRARILTIGDTVPALIERKVEEEVCDEGKCSIRRVLTVSYSQPKLGRVSREIEVANVFFYRRQKVGGETDLMFVPVSPEQVVLRHSQNSQGLWLRFVFGALAIAVYFYGFLWMWRKASRGREARNFGHLVSLSIRDIGSSSVAINGVNMKRVVWRFEDGTIGQSWLRSAPEIYFRDLKEGLQIEVYRLGDESFWVGDVGKRPEHL